MLEAAMLQHQGRVAKERLQLDRAANLYRRALHLFQEMQHEEGAMQTYNLLGIVEQSAGRLAEARAWYERAREMARRRNDRGALGDAAQNLGILCRHEGEIALRRGDEASARERFAEALRWVGESLAIEQANDNEPGMADSLSALARVHLLRGDVQAAEENATRARELHERLGMREAHMDYETLADVARARGRDEEATAWEEKRRAALVEIGRLAGEPALAEDTKEGLAALAIACAEAGLEGEPLDADTEDGLAALSTWPPPLDTLAPFFRALAAGELPDIPAALPEELADILSDVLGAVRNARELTD